jgi:hypothetical protein
MHVPLAIWPSKSRWANHMPHAKGAIAYRYRRWYRFGGGVRPWHLGRGGVQRERTPLLSTKHARVNTRLRCCQPATACTRLSAGSVGLGSGDFKQFEVNSPQGRNTLCGCMRSSLQEPCQLSRLPLPARPHHHRILALQIVVLLSYLQ